MEVTRRVATLHDVDAIAAMGERFRASTEYAARVPANLDQMRALAERIITSPDGVIAVAESDHALVGMLAAIVYTHHISGRRVAGEIAWWVDPEIRGTVGVRLLKDIERWARKRGAETLEMIAPSPYIEAIYSLLGYEPVERTYQKALRGGSNDD